jgi:hypothetical protein
MSLDSQKPLQAKVADEDENWSAASSSLATTAPAAPSGRLFSGQSLAHFIIRLVLTQTSHYHQVVKQCLANNRNETTTTAKYMCDSFGNNNGGAETQRRRLALINGNKPYARLAKWKLSVTIHDRFMLGLYLVLLIKYRLISLISPGSLLDELRYLDCFLFGRYKFIGRTDRCSGQIVTGLVILFGLYRIVVIYCEPRFRFYALEFLLNDFEDVQANELIRMESPEHENEPGDDSPTTVGSSTTKSSYGHHRQVAGRSAAAGTASGRTSSSSGGSRSAARKSRVDSICYIKNPFHLGRSEWYLRPNRSPESWLLLNQCTRIIFALLVLASVAWFAIIWYMIGGSIISDLGFEISYSTCVSWLRDEQFQLQRRQQHPQQHHHNHHQQQQQQHQLINVSEQHYYSYIYKAPKVIASEMKVDNLPARIAISSENLQRPTLYNVVRIAADLIENQLIYMEFNFAFSATLYLLTIQSIDVLINGNQIKAQLVDLLGRLSRQPLIDRSASVEQFAASPTRRQHTRSLCSTFSLRSMMDSHGGRRRLTTITSPHHCNGGLEGGCACACAAAHFRRAHPAPSWGLTGDMTRVQAILADHFQLTISYNRFMSFYFVFQFSLWISYTLVVCTWMGSIKSRAIETEFVMAETGATFLSVLLFSVAAMVRSRNAQLYPLMTQIMARDSTDSKSKLRWLTLIRFYYPKSLYCFTLLDTNEISWLYCLKVSGLCVCVCHRGDQYGTDSAPCCGSPKLTVFLLMTRTPDRWYPGSRAPSWCWRASST